MAIRLLKTPPYAPGERVADMLRDSLRVAVTDSVPAPTTTPATVTIAKVPANTLILGVLAEVVTACSVSTGALSWAIGDSDLTTALFNMTSDHLESTGFKASFLGKNYIADQDLIATITNASASGTTTGAVRFWLLYSTESNKRKVG